MQIQEWVAEQNEFTSLLCEREGYNMYQLQNGMNMFWVDDDDVDDLF